ncbi:hypothetical protein HYH03_009851 [Edaphochlamys debaryana]|uniref:Uncharacterized protein n=1 Tax=Edaphochlamys debaryana TaxID=47281 RepID=A0A835Y6H0_9CHLO|nr:hypothetical protein HYH03_009851 [Edaphochlamys debaryana]|eukprot:KAG2491899.1 hypothetical protein HYH03_009851 [Edaphochlamys debaryana]
MTRTGESLLYPAAAASLLVASLITAYVVLCSPLGAACFGCRGFAHAMDIATQQQAVSLQSARGTQPASHNHTTAAELEEEAPAPPDLPALPPLPSPALFPSDSASTPTSPTASPSLEATSTTKPQPHRLQIVGNDREDGKDREEGEEGHKGRDREDLSPAAWAALEAALLRPLLSGAAAAADSDDAEVRAQLQRRRQRRRTHLRRRLV